MFGIPPRTRARVTEGLPTPNRTASSAQADAFLCEADEFVELLSG